VTAVSAGPSSFEVVAEEPAGSTTRARLGRLTLPHGVVETPQFMPVGTNATVKSLDPDDLEAAGASIVLANTYHLFLRPGHERIERLGGLHRFMAWDRPILTDSGGFQVVSLADAREIDDDGVSFRSHIDGSIQRLTPESSIAVQEALGADVAVAFDHPVYPSSTRAEVEDAMTRTHRWAERSLRAHTRPDQALFGVIQGGLEADLRAASTQFIAGLPFDGLNIGGLAGDETPEQRLEVLGAVVRLLTDDPRPRYLMGLGSPADLLEAVLQGVDLFDSVLPSRVARTGQVWVPGGRLDLRSATLLDDPGPIEDGCLCLACRRFSRAYVAHLFRARELLAYRLATLHNLTFTLDFMVRIRDAIRGGLLVDSLPALRARAGRTMTGEDATMAGEAAGKPA
jgi:queuine tRNA-ribosyltransferase